MAKQIGIFKIIGTIGEFTFYEMDGEFYARKKSSLDGKRVKRDPKFRRTMEEAIGFGKASTATRAVYWALPAELRVHGFYGILTGRMRKLMRAGKTAKEAQLQLLRELCAEVGVTAQQDAHMNSKHDDFADQLLNEVFGSKVVEVLPDKQYPERLGEVAGDSANCEAILSIHKMDFSISQSVDLNHAKTTLPFFSSGFTERS